MILGGRYTGKLGYIKQTLHYNDREISMYKIGAEPVVYGLQDIPQVNEADLAQLMQKEVVACEEIGCGIVPMEREERERRERIGRLSIRLAEHAEQVIRMTAGIPVRIK